jgi:hypothetical protein
MEHQDPSCVDIRAVVTSVEEKYVVTYPLEPCGDLTTRESVTFSLSVWSGKHEPQVGQIVTLIDTCLWQQGWRANGARPVRPSKKQKGDRT